MGCSGPEELEISKSSLADSLYIQNSPSEGAQRQYVFSGDSLSIQSTDNVKPEEFDNEGYESAVSEEYQNVKVLETEDTITVTGEDDLELIFTKIAEGLLEDKDGVRFIKEN